MPAIWSKRSLHWLKVVAVVRPFATAGGKKKEGIPAVLREAAQLTESLAGQRNNYGHFSVKMSL